MLYLLIGCSLVSGIGTEERSEGRSGGSGVGTPENTGPLRCPIAETGNEGTHTHTSKQPLKRNTDIHNN